MASEGLTCGASVNLTFTHESGPRALSKRHGLLLGKTRASIRATEFSEIEMGKAVWSLGD
jgi:hypothetical protein